MFDFWNSKIELTQPQRKTHGAFIRRFYLLLLLLLLSLLLGACQLFTPASPWVRISDESQIASLAVNRVNGSVWVVDFFAEQIMYYPLDIQHGELSDPKTIRLDESLMFAQICPSDRIWVDNKFETGKNILVYLEEEDTWEIEEFPLFDEYIALNRKTLHCNLLPDGEVVFWGSKSLYIYDQSDIIEVAFDFEQGRISRVTTDESGTLWVVTDNGEIYSQDDANLEWELVFEAGDFVIPRNSGFKVFAITRNEVVWLGAPHGVYRLDLQQENLALETILEFKYQIAVDGIDSMEQVYFLAEDNNQDIWIITSEAAWRYGDGVLESIDLPSLPLGYFSLDFDPITNRIYLSTQDGIFYYQVASP